MVRYMIGSSDSLCPTAPCMTPGPIPLQLPWHPCCSSNTLSLLPPHGMFTCYPLHLKLSSLGFLDALCSHFFQGFPQMALLSHVFPNHPIEHDFLACPSTLSCLCHLPHCSAQYSNVSCTKERFHLYCSLLYAKFLEFYLVHSRCLKIFLKYYMIYSINQSMNKWFVQCHYNHMPSTTRKVRRRR